MNSWKRKLMLPALLVLMSSVSAASGQSPSMPKTSAAGSPPRATPATSRPDIAAACAATADDLTATKKLVEALDAENASLRERLATERRAADVLTELNESRRSEADALRSAVIAGREAIAAKDAVIAAQDKLIAELKRKRPSPWRRVGDILIGAAAAVIFR